MESSVKFDRIEGLLMALHGLSEGAALGQVDRLLERLHSGELRVLLAGEAKRGKSTLANALIGRDLLPSGVTPVTAIPTTIRSGCGEQLEVVFDDGAVEAHPLAELADFVAQGRNRNNRLGVDEVRVVLDGGLPTAGLVLIDSPGMGSVFTDNTAQAQKSLESMDMAILVLTSDAPMSAAERSLLHHLAQLSVLVVVVLNKTDQLSQADLGEATTFVAAVVEEVLGRPAVIYPCSARLALHARETDDQDEWQRSGVAALSAAIVQQITESRLDTVAASVAAAGSRVSAHQLDQRRIELAAAESTLKDRSEIVNGLQDVIGRLDQARAKAEALEEAGMHRLLRQLEELGSARVGALAGEAQQAPTTAIVASESRPAAELEEQGRAAMAAVLKSGIETLRADCLSEVQRDLGQQHDSSQELLERAYVSVFQGVRELLGIELSATAPAFEAIELPRLRYTFTEDVGWNHGIRIGLRHAGPHRRRRTIRFLQQEAARLADQHVGRLLGDLRAMLAETGRRRTALTEQAFDDLHTELCRAERSARQLAQLSQSDLAPERARLRRQVDELQRLAGSFKRSGRHSSSNS